MAVNRVTCNNRHLFLTILEPMVPEIKALKDAKDDEASSWAAPSEHWHLVKRQISLNNTYQDTNALTSVDT